ncbi:MAG TPA: APC family permease [Actinophytocola sp.]|uniref:APC family permease n=1 Tax=Actinophytocola sp. TaxID=1872138 RepID=UPI002DBDF868|nr:APC family permease [Actinophytocola sp.]HEU5475537.1 APC family permease [Actinophytocola sp.]
MTATAPENAPELPSVARKGLKLGAIGLLSSIVIAVASTAPGYSAAATLGGIAQEVGDRAPIVMLLAFLPMLFISYAYKSLNSETPDCGTSFTWVARVLGRRTGWLTGWVIVVADVIVMASLAQIAASYSFQLLGLESLADNKLALIAAGSAWILVMTWIAWRGIEMSARTQYVLLGAELIILAVFSVVALVKVYTGTAGEQAITLSWSWFNPFTLSFSALSAGFLLAVFIYWGWDSAVSVNEETQNPSVNPGRSAVISTVLLLLTYLMITIATQAFAGVGTEGIGLANPANEDDVFAVLGPEVLGSWGAKLVILAVLTSAAASTQTTILPTARTTLAMAAYQALPRSFGTVHPRYQTPTLSTWAMGVVSVACFAGFYIVSEGSLADLVLSIGLLIAFYYGLTGVASAWHFRQSLRAGPKPALQQVILPFLGALLLFAAFVKTALDLLDPGSGDTTLFGVGGAFLYGIGSILLGVVLMIVYQLVSPSYFRGDTMDTK